MSSNAIAVRDNSFNADFDAVYDQLRPLIDGDELTAENLTPLVMRCIRLVERISKQSKDGGAQKKQLVIRLIERLIEDADMSPAARELLLVVVDQVVPSIIDGLIEADHGRLLKDGMSATRRFFARMCCK